MHFKTAVFLLAGLLFYFFADAQYILNGSATQLSCNCYQLTPAQTNQSGSVWNSNKISLLNPFDFTFNVFLGCQDASGADGLVFMLQPLSTSVGSSGEGMGFSGVQPSIGITLDTYTNTNLNDPSYDHISIQANGNPAHGSDLSGPLPISDTSDNVEDCQWHRLRITWDPAGNWLRAWFDGVLRVQCQLNLVTAIFNGDPNVFWGFSAATGGSFNVQQFCTALNPDLSAVLPSDTFCIGTPAQFLNNSVSFAPLSAYYWSYGDGSSSTLANPPPHSWATPGNYQLKFAITALDGCQSDTLRRNIHVAALPSGSFQVWDTCAGREPRLLVQTSPDVALQWKIDGLSAGSGLNPTLSAAVGHHTVDLLITSLYGCGSSLQSSQQLNFQPIPVFIQQVSGGCVLNDIPYAGVISNAVPVASWSWDFDNGAASSGAAGMTRFTDSGNYQVRTWAISTEGCSSDTATTIIFINRAFADAGPDKMAVGRPVSLEGSGNGTFSWWPAGGLSDAAIAQPMALVPDTTVFHLLVTTPEGCTATDSMKLLVFTGSDIRVPNAFTPDNNGRNDRFKPYYKGISTLQYFMVYNRWGQAVFQTTDLSKSWDGRVGDREAGNETFMWMLHATDWAGKVYQLKGTVTVIH